jgi:hypothetical protein
VKYCRSQMIVLLLVDDSVLCRRNPVSNNIDVQSQ